METVGDSRSEKRIIEIQAERATAKRNAQQIEHLHAKIEEEKLSVAQAMECGFYGMAKRKIERIEEITQKIAELILAQ